MKKLLSTLCLFVLSFSVYAGSDADLLAERLTQYQSMKAEFEQVIQDARGRSLQESSGRVSIERPGKFRWYTSEPLEQLIVGDGKRLWIYDIDLDQATVQDFKDTMGSAPAVLLSGTPDEWKDTFTISKMKSVKGGEWFKLVPKASNELFKWAEMGFKDNKLSKMRLLDHLDQTTELRFNHVETNPTLKPSIFKFSPPKGVDVIYS